MAAVAHDALVGAGADEVLSIGGDGPALEAIGFRALADHHRGQGPLGGLVRALQVAIHDPVVVLACDHPRVSATTIADVLRGLDDPSADASIPLLDGYPQVLLAAYRSRALGPLAEAFESGVRAVHRAVASLNTKHPALSEPSSARDANDPLTLARLTR